MHATPLVTRLSPGSRPAPLRLASPVRTAPAPTQRLADALRRNPRLSPRLRDALLQACTSPRPFRSVWKLSSVAGCDRRTLWRDWRAAMGEASPLRLEDVLHWIIFARAMEMKAPGQSWSDVAESVAVHAQTLARFARHFTRRSLRGVTADPAGSLLALERALLPYFAPREVPQANAA
ncbi:MAG: hypothetical protein JO306_08000 [Gemmatimonadetes bacterium]|nr:hypothetical protein [Gemmatimonadota bacterium]